MRLSGREYLKVAVGCIISIAAMLPYSGCVPVSSPPLSNPEVNRAATLVQDKKYDEAITILDNVTKRYASWTPSLAYFWRGRAYYKLKQNEQALVDINIYIKYNTGEGNGYMQRGYIYEALKRYDDAVADYTEAIRLQPLAYCYYIRAKVYESQGKHQERIRDLTSTLNAKNDNMVNLYGKAWKRDVLWYRGQAYAKVGDQAAAKVDAFATMEYRPHRKLVFNEENILDYLDLDKRQQETDKAIKTAADAEASGNLLTAFRTYEQARAWMCSEADETTIMTAFQRLYPQITPKPALPEQMRKYAVQAEVASADKKYAEAIELYDKALDISPWWPQAYFNIAMLQANLNKFAEAIESMKTYLKLDPNAQDARSAQDQVYEWEYKLKQATTTDAG